MKNYLKNYKATLTVNGPVFIGSGREITKKEYLLLDGGNEIGVLDMPAFYEFLTHKHLQRQFDDFMLNDARSDLRHWLMEHRIAIAEVRKFFKYVLETGELQMVRKTQVMEFVKDPFGCPYVPGSSLKGMLRTILLTEDILSNPDDFSSDIRDLRSKIPQRNRKNLYLNREIKRIEDDAFHTLNRKMSKHGDAVNDALSGLIVSDSEPLDISSLVLCQKYDRNPAGIEKPLPLMRECLKPGTRVCVDITIDESKLSLNDQKIMESVNDFIQIYNEYFLSKFRDIKPAPSDTVYLGGGVGFVTKTIIYPAFGKDSPGIIADIFNNTKVPANHNHADDRRLGVSPHIVKCTRYMGKSVQMGPCTLSITENAG